MLFVRETTRKFEITVFNFAFQFCEIKDIMFFSKRKA